MDNLVSSLFRRRWLASMLLSSYALITTASAATEAPVMVVTGTKTEKALLDVPVRTEIVTAAELANSHARDLAEGLKNVPGLMLKPIHGKSGQEVWLQGINADRVLVLIDGLPVTASTGSSVDLSQIAVADVQHIEIVKGAVSALYGSEAMGGVVNIITKRATAGTRYQFTLDGGSYGNQHNVSSALLNDQHANLLLSKNSDTWYAQLMADIRHKGGSDLDLSDWDFAGDAGDKTNLSLELGYLFANGGELTVKPSWYQEDIYKNFGSFVPGIGKIKKVKGEQASRKNILLAYNQPLTDHLELSSWYMYEEFEDKTSQDTLSTQALDQSRIGLSKFDKVELQLDSDYFNNHLVTFGAVAYRSSLNQQQISRSQQNQSDIDELNGTKRRNNLEFYLQDDFFLTDNLELLPGIRVQHDSDFGVHAAPKFNLMYRPDTLSQFDGKIRSGIGTGYRVPTLKERHYVFDHSALGYMILGNPDLVPETSVSLQLGAELHPNADLMFDINLFHNEIKNLIDTAYDQQASDARGLSIFNYNNVNQAMTQGVDISASYQWLHNWQTNLSYSYLNSEDKTTGQQLTRRPAHLIKGKLNYHLAAINTDFSLYGNYQTKEYLDAENLRQSPAYSTFDFKVNYFIQPQTRVFFGIDNLTDTVRDTPATGTDFRPEVGRFVYLGLRIEG
ncbi:TonB-dependent receptor [Motilimonas sp. E26]|uniref:TonB-dependent receptor plug domain-containing protein n=1 Tax=Motilimonas sp. E26 TaxID=2865674 RepID=UPI001E2EF94E|nr:TonB-dependent receptor [Motilimonas sp. E26]MCE0557719.1 TonB-dependent receptor [Motilimonas sp. E26]